MNHSLSAFYETLRIVCLALATVPVPGPVEKLDDRAPTTQELIQRLSDENPGVRAEAEKTLQELGEAARPQIVLATRSAHPGIASRASQILLAMPWYAQTDPPAVRQILADYGRRDEPHRIESISALAALQPNLCNPVLLRLVMEDPSEDVCWQAGSMLRARMNHATVMSLRELDPGPTRSAALTLAAGAWFGRDRARSLDLYERAVAAEAARPAYDGGELDVAFDRLCEAAVRGRQPDDAARLRRAQAARIGIWRDAYPTPIFELFALHARHGPLSGFASDLARYGVETGQPQVLYAMSRLYRNSGQEIVALAMESAARCASLTSNHRLLVSRFLVEQGWNDLAERELDLMLSEAAEKSGVGAVNAHLRLAGLARQRGDDRAAAEHLAHVQRLLGAGGGTLQRTRADGQSVEYDVRVEIEFLRYRAAAPEQRDQHLTKLLSLVAAHVPSSEIVNELVPTLRAQGRKDDAASVFAGAYESVKATLHAEPDNPALQNELAWLCARSGERPEEALALATRAVADQPDNAAFLDTAAEANFQVGNIDEAIRLEARALELEPGDKFMTEQLARFKAGRK